MIRNLTPKLLAQDIMGLGPPVCTNCMILGSLTDHTPHPWRCLRCGDVRLGGHLWSYIKATQVLIELRTDLASRKNIMDFGNHIFRKFMMPDDIRDPNDRYRPWLEEKVGKQGEDWDWDLAVDTDADMWNKLKVTFRRHEDAILFELSCP